MKARKLISTAMLTVMLALGGATTSYATDNQQQGADVIRKLSEGMSEGDVLATTFNTNLGETYSYLKLNGEAKSHTASLSPAPVPYLDPITIGLCNAGFGETVIEKFPSRIDGTVSLKCGDNNSGYIHIRNRHQVDWRNQQPGGGNWDDFMVWASRQALTAPTYTSVQPGQKRCYTTPVQLYRIVNGKPQYYKTFNPSIVVSTNNKKIITAIPSNWSTC